MPKPRPVEDLIFESLPDDMAKRTFSRVRDVDGEEVTETYFGIGWQPSAAELAEHALPAGPRKSAKVELTKHTYPYVCAFAKKEGMTLSGRAHGQATGEEGDETWSHNHYLQQVIARPRLAPSAPIAPTPHLLCNVVVLCHDNVALLGPDLTHLEVATPPH